MIERRRSREIEELVHAFVEQLTEAVESATSARAQVLGEELLRAAASPQPHAPERSAGATPEAPSPVDARAPDVGEAADDVQPHPPRAARGRPRRRPPSPATGSKAALPIDPEEERRAAERARVRAILRPTAPAPATAPVMTPPPRAAEENDSLEALEDRIRDQIPALAALSQSRYTAQIAAWAGRVRLHQSGPDGERTRIASRMLFEKLRNLAWSMEAGPIEALNSSWAARDWRRYIEDNELIVASPDAPPRSKPEPDAEAEVWATTSSETDTPV